MKDYVAMLLAAMFFAAAFYFGYQGWGGMSLGSTLVAILFCSAVEGRK